MFRYGQAELDDQIGVVTGLAYTTVGGDTLSIEVSLSPGRQAHFDRKARRCHERVGAGRIQLCPFKGGRVEHQP